MEKYLRHPPHLPLFRTSEFRHKTDAICNRLCHPSPFLGSTTPGCHKLTPLSPRANCWQNQGYVTAYRKSVQNGSKRTDPSRSSHLDLPTTNLRRTGGQRKEAVVRAQKLGKHTRLIFVFWPRGCQGKACPHHASHMSVRDCWPLTVQA